MKIAIGSTKVGLSLKKDVIEYLEGINFTVEDLGMKENGVFIPYYEAAARVAIAVSQGRYERAIIICGSGAGSAIVANKFKGVYAVLATSEYEAKQAKAINNANVLALGEWITPSKHALEIVKVWLSTEFTEGFEPDRQEFLKKAYLNVQDIEKNNFR